MNAARIAMLFDLDKTIAKELFEEKLYPWEVLPAIEEFIVKLGNTLPADKFEKRGEDIWIAKSAKVFPSAYIGGPCIIDENAQIRHCAFIRGSAIVGKNVVVGNSTELKNVVLFDNVKVPHYNYVGDSILGYKAHMGAGSIACNLKSDESLIKIKDNEKVIETCMRKVGAILGDNAEIGCNAVLCPGTVIGKNSRIYSCCVVRGVIKENKIYKNENNIIDIV